MTRARCVELRRAPRGAPSFGGKHEAVEFFLEKRTHGKEAKSRREFRHKSDDDDARAPHVSPTIMPRHVPSFPVPAPASVPRAFDLTSYMGQFHDQLASRTERCEAPERELDSTKKERDECVAALRATAMSLATAQSDLASERAANEELRRQMSEMLRDHQEWKGAMARNDAELAEMRATTAREKEVEIQRECKRIVDDLKRELRDTKKRAATEKAKMAAELKQATAMRDAHAAQTELLLVERNKLGDELMRVRTKAKLAGKAKAANPGLTPSPAPGAAYRSALKQRERADEAKPQLADDRDDTAVVLSPFTPNPASASPGGAAGTAVRRKSRLTHGPPDHPTATPTPQTPPTNPSDVDSAYKPMGPGRDCTLDAAAKEKGWNKHTVRFAWVDENIGWSNESPARESPGVSAALGETTLVAMRKKALAESARVGLARAGRKPLTVREVRDVSSVVTVGVEYPR